MTHYPAYLVYKREHNEYQKQTTDQLLAYYELYNWDNFGLCDDSRRRKFEQLCTQAHYEQIGYIPLPKPDDVIAYYSARYDIDDHGIPPKLAPWKIQELHDSIRAESRKQYRKEQSALNRQYANELQESAAKTGYVVMTFGGSHRLNARIKSALENSAIRYESCWPIMGKYKHYSVHVHKDDVPKARAIGLKIRRA